MSGIQKLDGKVSSVLRSQVSTVSLASAVTELVYNSIDAEATKVEVLVDISSMSLMICDNGKGMIPNDLDKLGSHNATSKISGIRDLTHLKTHGFRGEAIYCIANVSHFTIASKVKDYSCGRIRTLPHSSMMFTEKVPTKNSSMLLEPFAMQQHGTKVVVGNLLYNTPVRRRIIQNEPAYKTYAALKENLFQVLVLHPELQLKVDCINDLGTKSTLFASTNVSAQLTAHQKLSYAFLNTFGNVVPLESLRRVSVGYKEFNLSGIISRNAIRVKDFQLIYINGREYRNMSLLRMVDNLFQTTVFENNKSNSTDVKSVGRPYTNHAVVIMDIRCPQKIDDLLQDRSKKLLLSSYSDVLHPLIIKVIRSFLSHEGFAHTSHEYPVNTETAVLPTINHEKINAVLNSQIRMAMIDDREIRGRMGKGRLSSRRSRDRSPYHNSSIRIGKRLAESALTSVSQSNFPPKVHKGNDHCCNFSLDHDQEYSISRSHLKAAEVINQVGKKFILLKIRPDKKREHSTLVIVDQHASDERIKLETYLKEFIDSVVAGTIQSQPVSNCTIEVSSTELELFKHFRDEFFSWGICYHLDSSSGSSFICITSLPTILNQKFNDDKDYLRSVLQQMVQDMKNLKTLSIRTWIDQKGASSIENDDWSKCYSCIPEVFREIFNSKACRSAIMFGDTLSKNECSFLIKKLAECWLPFQCAHGRPSIVPLAHLGTDDEDMRGVQGSFFLDYDANEPDQYPTFAADSPVLELSSNVA